MALDRVCILLKRGDNGAHTNGAPICHIDELDWKLPLESIISVYCSKAYLPVIIDRKLLPFIIAGYQPVYDEGIIIDPFTTAEPLFLKSIKMDFSMLETSLGISGLKNRVATEESLGILDGTRLTDLDFTPMKAAEPVKDVMAITTGSYTVGAEMNYATWALFTADIGSPFTGNLTGTQTSAVTETAQSYAVNRNLAGHNLTITSAIDPKGNFNNGYLLSHNFNNTLFYLKWFTSSSAANVNISNLNVKIIAAPTVVIAIYRLQPDNANITNNLNNLLVNCNNQKCGVFYTETNLIILKMFNCIFANGDKTAWNSYGLKHSIAMNTNSVIENCTFYNMYAGYNNWSNVASGAFRNNAAFGNTKDFTYGTTPTSGLGNTVASKCASSDATGSETALRNLVTASQFLSTDITSADFLKLKRSSILTNGGVAPSISTNTTGIQGNSRPHYAWYSIGADEFAGKKQVLLHRKS